MKVTLTPVPAVTCLCVEATVASGPNAGHVLQSVEANTPYPAAHALGVVPFHDTVKSLPDLVTLTQLPTSLKEHPAPEGWMDSLRDALQLPQSKERAAVTG